MNEDKKIARIYAPKIGSLEPDDLLAVREDDLPGLVAALKNQRVVIDGKAIEPGADVIVEGRVLFLSKRLIVRSTDDPPLSYVDEMAKGPFIEVRVPDGKVGRRVTISQNILVDAGNGDKKKWLEEY